MKLPLKIDHDNPIPFDKIEWQDFIPQFKMLKEKAVRDLEILIDKPTSFQNTIIGLNRLTLDFDNLSSIFDSLTSVYKPKSKSKQIDKISQTLNIINIELISEISFNKKLFAKVDFLYKNLTGLAPEDKKLLEITYNSFIDAGINLSDEKQSRLSKIHEELGLLYIQFDANILNDSECTFIEGKNSDDLIGLSLDFIDESTNNKGHYKLPVNEANYCEVLENAHNRKLREKMFHSFRSIGAKNNKFNNFEIIKKILILRQEESKIHGHNNFIDFSLKDRMIKNIQLIKDTFNELEKKASTDAQKNQKKLEKEALKDNIVLQKWDEFYYQNILKEKELDLDFNILREYFPLQTVWEGLQELIRQLYNVSFIKANFPVYREDVESYIVKDNVTDKVLGTLYMDWFAHPDKQDGAWMFPILNNSHDQESVVLLAFNYLKGDQNLLSIGDVKTMFHEVGHGLHSLFSNQKYDELNGINVAWDFVELPSQIMENFVLEPEVLDKIAKHYLTNEKLDLKTIKKLQSYNDFFASNLIMSNIQFSKIDLILHSLDPSLLTSFEHLEKIFSSEGLQPMPTGTSRISSFDHIISGGYAAGYYSYLWAELLDSDCYSKFKENGILNPQIAAEFRKEILESGKIREEEISFQKFMNRDLKIDSFLSKKGLK